jgi:two-component system phosphate regulon sensor histidine kinase PhoR
LFKKKRLLWQLYSWYLVITLFSLVSVTWFTSRAVQSTYLKILATDLESQARLAERVISPYLAPLDTKMIDSLCKELGRETSTRLTVILPSGKVIGDSANDPAGMENHANRPEIREALSGRPMTLTRYSPTFQKKMMYTAVPISKNGSVSAVLRTSMSLSIAEGMVWGTQKELAAGALITALLVAGVSFLVYRRISLPLEEMRRGAECFARGDFGHRLRISRANCEEISGLAEAMNKMAAHLEDRIKTVMQQRYELEAVLSSMVEGVLAVDTEERVISMNQAASYFLEKKYSEIMGKSIQEIVRNPELQKFISRALSAQEPVEGDMVLSGTDERTMQARGTTLYGAEGRRVGAVIVLNDVTRLRRLENVRRDFVANVSHEIRTPVTAIKGFVETLRDGALHNPEQAGRFLEIIEKQVNRLSAIIEDLLRLTRIEQEQVRGEISLGAGSIRDVLYNAVQLCSSKASAKRISIQLKCAEDVTARIDPLLIEQAVVNLIDNAINYSEPSHEVQVEASQTHTEVLISVQDQGCGIEKRHLPRLFERFYRVDKARSRKLGGTGLGLAIVKHIIQYHGGRVMVDSIPGQGSTFIIHLPRT